MDGIESVKLRHKIGEDYILVEPNQDLAQYMKGLEIKFDCFKCNRENQTTSPYHSDAYNTHNCIYCNQIHYIFLFKLGREKGYTLIVSKKISSELIEYCQPDDGFIDPRVYLMPNTPPYYISYDISQSEYDQMFREVQIDIAKKRNAELMLSVFSKTGDPIMNAESLIVLGNNLRETGKYQEAIEAFKQAIILESNNAIAYYNLGTAYGNLNRHQEAIEAYKQALNINPNLAEAYCNLGNAYGRLNRHQEAIEAYKQALNINPNLAEAYYNLGTAYGNLNRNQEAVEAYKQCIRIDPDIAMAYCNLGVVYSDLGYHQEAVEAYKQALNINPNDALACCNLGTAYGRLRFYHLAIEAFKQAIQIKPDYANAHFNLGITYAGLGHYQEATEAYKQAIRINPNDSNIRKFLDEAIKLASSQQSSSQSSSTATTSRPSQTSSSSSSSRSPSESIRTIKLGDKCPYCGGEIEPYKTVPRGKCKACGERVEFTQSISSSQSGDEANAKIWFDKGNALAEQGRYQEATEAFIQAIMIKPDYAEAYLNLGTSYLILGRYHSQEAIEAFIQAIQIKPDYAAAYLNLGTTYGVLGRYQESIEACKQAIIIEPDYTEAYYSLGVTYRALGHYQEAIEACKQAINIEPNNDKVYSSLGIAYFMLGRYQEAIEAYKQAIRINPNDSNIRKCLDDASKLASSQQSSSQSSSTATTSRLSQTSSSSSSSRSSSEPTMRTINRGDPCPYCGGEINPFVVSPYTDEPGKCKSCGRWVQFSKSSSGSSSSSSSNSSGTWGPSSSSTSSSSPSTSSSNSGGCFIATEVYGDNSVYGVLVLRSWRDRCLSNSIIGRRFIRFYYKNSPSVVLWIKNKPNVKNVIKSILDLFIKLCLRKYAR